MNIGYLYGFDAYPPRGGNGVHAYQLVRWFTEHGHIVHTIGDSKTPWVDNHSSDETGIISFLGQIDILYVRIHGWYFDHDAIKKTCIERASVPIVWQINAPTSEILARYEMFPNSASKGIIAHLYKKYSQMMKGMRLLPSIYRDESIRRCYA